MSATTVFASGLFVIAVADGCRTQAEAPRSPEAPPPASASTVQTEPASPDPIAAKPPADAETKPEPAPKTPTVVTLESLRPFYGADVEEGWLVVSAPADSDEWERVANKSWDPMWAGNPAIPKSLKEFPPLHFVWSGGVDRRDAYARVGVDTFGWKIEYKPKGIKGPVLAMVDAPPEGTTLRPGAKATRIRRSHAMAVRMEKILADEGDEWTQPRGRLKTFTLQTTLGRFGAADRVIAVAGTAPPPPEEDMGDDLGVVFTADAASNRVQQIAIMAGATKVVALVDIDGDGVDEILTETRGYELGSSDLHRVTPSGVERVNLWQHEE